MALIPFKSQGGVWRSPFYELDKLHREMDRLFDISTPWANDKEASLFSGSWAPLVDVIEKKDNIVVKADLPGLTKDDISVTIENNVLSIAGDYKQAADEKDKDGQIIRSERSYGVFHRAFTLPSMVDPEKVNAKFTNGVLELTIAKKEEARPKQIKVDVK